MFLRASTDTRAYLIWPFDTYRNEHPGKESDLLKVTLYIGGKNRLENLMS